MSVFGSLFGRRGAPALQRVFAEKLVATVVTVDGTEYPGLDAILGAIDDDEEYVNGDRKRRRRQTITLRTCNCDERLPAPEIGATIKILDRETDTTQEWAVDRLEAWSETYVVLQCVRIGRIERGVPGYRMSR